MNWDENPDPVCDQGCQDGWPILVEAIPDFPIQLPGKKAFEDIAEQLESVTLTLGAEQGNDLFVCMIGFFC